MKDLSGVSYFEPAEKLVKVLCKKTQSEDPLFFRVLTAYYFTKVASMMRCSIKTPDRGNIPVSLYAINLASSGFGKGHATNIIEEQIINKFQVIFNRVITLFCFTCNSESRNVHSYNTKIIFQLVCPCIPCMKR